jgi:hypothetical protein
VIGGSLGLGLAWLIVQRRSDQRHAAVFILPRATSRSARADRVLGLIAGALPAFNAMNLKITDALRRG